MPFSSSCCAPTTDSSLKPKTLTLTPTPTPALTQLPTPYPKPILPEVVHLTLISCIINVRLANGIVLQQTDSVQELFGYLKVLTSTVWTFYPIVVFLGRAQARGRVKVTVTVRVTVRVRVRVRVRVN